MGCHMKRELELPFTGTNGANLDKNTPTKIRIINIINSLYEFIKSAPDNPRCKTWGRPIAIYNR